MRSDDSFVDLTTNVIPPIADHLADMLLDSDIKEENLDRFKPAKNSPSLNLTI